MQWFRGKDCDISAELADLLDAASSSRRQEAEGGGDAGTVASTLAAFRQPSAYKPFLILVTTFFLQQTTGTYAVIFYAVNVFRDIGVTADPYLAAIIIGLIRLIGTYLLKLSRKLLP